LKEEARIAYIRTAMSLKPIVSTPWSIGTLRGEISQAVVSEIDAAAGGGGNL
jgi:hypothetical protein